MHKRIRHRLTIFAPLLVAVIGSTVAASSAWSVTGELSQHAVFRATATQPLDVALSPAVVVRLMPGAMVERIDEHHLRLIVGSVLVAADADAALWVGGMSLRGWHGSFFVTRGTDSVTVAAVSTPVVIAQNGAWHVVPVGMQWRGERLASFDEGRATWLQSRTLAPVPMIFLLDQLRAAKNLLSLLPPAASGSVGLSLPVLSSLQLPRAAYTSRLRSEQERLEDLAVALRHDAGQAMEMLDAPDLQTLLRSPRAQSSLPAILAAAISSGASPTGALLLLLQDPVFLLLADFHPALRSLALAVAAQRMLSSDQQQIVRFFLPVSDTLRDPLPYSAIIGWRALWDTDEQRASLDSAAPFFRSSLEHLSTLLLADRVERWSQAMIDVILPAHESLTSDGQDALRAIERMHAAPLILPPLTASSVDAATAVVYGDDPHLFAAVDVERHLMDVRDVLSQRGFMMLPRTVFTHHADGSVTVQGIVLAARDHDAELTFRIDPETLMVGLLQPDGTQYPNDMSLDDYVAWVKR